MYYNYVVINNAKLSYSKGICETEATIHLQVSSDFEGAIKCRSTATDSTAWMYFTTGVIVVMLILRVCMLLLLCLICNYRCLHVYS